MTAIAFILGVVPMVIATGAGAASRFSMGVTVLGGMTAATLFGIILIPALYVMFQWLGDKFGGIPDDLGAVPPEDAPPPQQASA